MRELIVPVVFWCAAAFFLVCAYPISPPGEVSGLSATVLAHGLFFIATCVLVVRVLALGVPRLGSTKKERLRKLAASLWLGLIVVFLYLAITDLVRRGPEGMTPFLLIGYGVLLLILSGVYFLLRWRAGP